MDNYLIITKNLNGRYTIKDSITDSKITYYFRSERAAIAEHRKSTGTQGRHFIKVRFYG